MKKIFIATMLVLFASTSLLAQDYNTGIGLRGGPYLSFTVKHFLSEKAALEGLVSTRWKGIEVTGLYEIHNQAFQVEKLNWYFGGGAHLGFYDGNYTGWGNTGTNYINVGIDGILGLEYNFSEIPLNLSIDWKPAFDLSGYTGFRADNGAFAIRYIF
jgi:hypothetical protein